MKSLLEILDMTAEGRTKFLKTTVTTARNAKATIAKILVAAEEQGDFGPGEMNAYAQRITGIELRREIQGTYEAVNVLKGIRAGTVGLTETQFETCPDFGRVTISGLLSKEPGLVPAAVEIILSKEDVTNRLKELTGKGKKAKEETPKLAIVAKGGEGEAEGEPSGIQTASAPAADTFVIPHEDPVMNHAPLMDRLMAEVKNAATVADAKAYVGIFESLLSHAESRLETLEAEAAPVETRELAVA